MSAPHGSQHVQLNTRPVPHHFSVLTTNIMYNTMNTLSSLAGGTLSNREGFGDCQTSKRRKLRDPCRDADEEASFEISDPFADISLYALPDSLVYAPSTGCYPQQTLIACPSASDSSTAVPYTASDQLGLSTPVVDWLHLLGLNSFDAVLPDRASRIIPIALPNPYSDNAHNRISSIETIVTYAPENGEVNGYVKFKMFKPGSIHEPPPTRIPLRFQSAQETHLRRDDEEEQTTATATGRVSLIGGKARVVKIPRNFGLGCNLRPYERKIFRFYIDAFCSGRTILPKSNSWKVDLGPMLPTSEIVRNALLALASTYLLGYTPDENLRILANRYYHLAVVGLTKRLQDAEQWEIGKGDDIVATFSLLNLHDAVTWEYRRGLDEVPRWLEGARTAAKFLDVTDPGYRYYKPGNVQTSSARTGNMVNIARVAIFALPFTPLDVANTSNKKFGWLLHGTSASVHRIHGTAGYSPKLLHIWAQITHLAAKFSTDPDHHVIPSLAEVIFNRLERLSQWSDLSKGHSSTKDLLEACVLDADGLITEPWEMVALGAECWKLAAQVYLLCRLSRLPRTHPDVLTKLTELSECLRRLPCGGSLFTSMTPLLPCFLLGIVSIEDRHRNVARDWFLGVISLNPCRSCVPPSWEMMKRLWSWMETETMDAPGPVPEAIEDRDPWWEKVVMRIMKTEGTTCVH